MARCVAGQLLLVLCVPNVPTATGGTPGSSCGAVLKDTALGGHNLKDYVDTTMNVTRCCEFCDSMPDCVGWTLDARNFHCYAKDKIDSPKISGAIHSLSGRRPGVQPSPPSPVPGPPKVHPVPGDHPVPAPKGAKNVLFIICDDMRPQLGAYGHSFMHTPHIDQLAATGTLFNKAYVQYSFCAPSRNSFMVCTDHRPLHVLHIDPLHQLKSYAGIFDCRCCVDWSKTRRYKGLELLG